MDRECVEKYKEKLERGITEYMNMPLSQRSAEAVEAMVECWEHINAMLKESSRKSCEELTEEETQEWNAMMQNEDGTIGGHWTVEETESVGNPGIEEHLWNVAMNMIYSDYYGVAEKYGVATAEFFADMAKAFLYDKDAPAPEEKLKEYFCHIVGNEE